MEVAGTGRAFIGNGGGPNRSGVLLQGSGAYGRIVAYDYGMSTAMNLVLQDSGGNVGIGTTNPQSKLEIYGSNNAIGVGLTNYGWGNANLIGSEYGAWNASRTNASGSYYYRWTGNSSTHHVAYVGQELNSSSWGLAFKTDSKTSKTHATSTRMFINTTGEVGIGTTNPTDKLTINGNTRVVDPTNQNRFLLLHGNGHGNKIRSYGGNLLLETRLDSESIEFKTNNSVTPLMLVKGDGSVGIGTTNPNGWKLAVNGQIRAKEIKVETGWSDFVFEKDYDLPTLKEVEKYIKEKGHLKDIPSAKEVEENGIFLGEMDSKLLQKIEELTLYTIQQEKRIKSLEEKNEQLILVNKKFLEFQTRLEELEKD
ncbi:hypothetical protein ACOKFD_05900 [Flagellimonas sp. S174]|uniref:hypothetical protein n=1 Tax=Flagellimonas sp. S174 TaxID=3410790 RepID=UPI003BF47E17